MENKFFVGQKVWSPIYRHGLVASIENSSNVYCIGVNFNNRIDALFFTNDGKYNLKNPAPTLFPADAIPDFYKPYAQDPRIGKWGYFWENNFKSHSMFGKLKGIKEGKFTVQLISMEHSYENFSLEIPEHCK